MSSQIKKIDSIKNMAVFQDFQWKSSVKDKGNNTAEFKKINIIYGRNYSGKTTLSRIFRGMETGFISEKYASPEFNLSFDDGTQISQNSLIGHGHVIRVFNEDFVRENLRFIIDDEHAIKSFAILGEDNTKLEDEIANHEEEIGSEEDRTGLIGKMLEKDNAYIAAKSVYDNKSLKLENKLRDKANNPSTGIKHNKSFGDANYNVVKIKADIALVNDQPHTPITPEQIENHLALLKEEAKPTVPELEPFNLSYTDIVSKTKLLIEKKIQISEPIQDLLSDAVLETWVRSGREYHEDKRTKCAFCGNVLPLDLWERLDKHFNIESEELRDEIEELILFIEAEKKRVPKLLDVETRNFYSNFIPHLEELKQRFDTNSVQYIKTLDALKQQLDKRLSNIFRPQQFIEPASVEQGLSAISDKYESLRHESNNFTKNLSRGQSKARLSLRLHEVFTFINDINYNDEIKAIVECKKNMEDADKAKIEAQNAVNEKALRIIELKNQLKDESKGADKVNHYLNNFFGHQSLTLRAVKNVEEETEVVGYRFEVTRNDQKAHHLSEGESSLIAFCYFMAKLEDVETKGSQPIVWIDDPVSSLDANHIFFVYSLINAEIVTPDNAEQLFISTHNLDFLKYIKRLPGASNKKESQYFIINCVNQSSDISLMPRYLKEYVTEFNYLFHQIYKCAHAQIDSDENHDCYYNFGNNARKFLEAFLYFKYPNATDKDDKLYRFFGNDALAASLTDRVNNEYSHLAGVFERSISPLDVPEMKTTASYILQKISEKDPDQYNALLQSIGILPDDSENNHKSIS